MCDVQSTSLDDPTRNEGMTLTTASMCAEPAFNVRWPRLCFKVKGTVSMKKEGKGW